MGLFDAPMANTTQNGTTTGTRQATTSYPGWTQTFNQNLSQAGWNLLGPDIARPQNGWVADFNADQNNAFEMARDAAGGMSSRDPRAETALQNLAGGSAGRVDPAQLGPTEFRAFMNPFLDSVGKSTLNDMRDEYRNADADLASRFAARQAFGGSGEALARGRLAGEYTGNVGEAVANLMSQGFDRATSSAMANMQNRQDAEVRNAALEQILPSIFSSAQTEQQSRQRAALQDLLGIGGMQQQREQTVRDVPLRNLEILLGMAPNVYDTTQTVNESSTNTGVSRAPTGAPSTGQQLLGFGLDVLGGLF